MGAVADSTHTDWILIRQNKSLTSISMKSTPSDFGALTFQHSRVKVELYDG